MLCGEHPHAEESITLFYGSILFLILKHVLVFYHPLPRTNENMSAYTVE